MCGTGGDLGHAGLDEISGMHGAGVEISGMHGMGLEEILAVHDVRLEEIMDVLIAGLEEIMDMLSVGLEEIMDVLSVGLEEISGVHSVRLEEALLFSSWFFKTIWLPPGCPKRITSCYTTMFCSSRQYTLCADSMHRNIGWAGGMNKISWMLTLL